MHGGDADQLFKHMDENDDGLISIQEFTKFFEQVFNRAQHHQSISISTSLLLPCLMHVSVTRWRSSKARTQSNY